MRRALGILAVLSLNHLYLVGQAPLVSNGQAVRVTSPRDGVYAEAGQVLAATSDTIVVQLTGFRTVHYRQVYRTDTLAFPIAAIERLEVRKHTGHHTGAGALIGFGVGATTGYFVGRANYTPCPPQSWFCWGPSSSTAAGIYGAVSLGLLGAAVGALIGRAITADKWEAIPLSTASVRVLPRHEVGLGLTIGF